jgi:hypothetical protein
MMRTTLMGALLLASGTAFAATGSDEFSYTLVLFLHQVLFVFWLGPDIGVYMWSTKATNPEVTPAQRVAAGRMMRSIEIIPRACMSLMLTVGGVLTEMMGLEHPWWQMVGIWLLGPVWLTLTLLVYFREESDQGAQLDKLDSLFRWVVIITVLASVVYSVATERLAGAPWVTGKLLIFAAVVFFGLMMRKRLAPFARGIDQLEAEGPSPALDQTLASSVARARIFMFAAWIALAIAAGLGLVQPGSANVVAAEQLEMELPE